MARNKYPQETVDRILDTAQALFLERGYEHTTIQDIVEGLGGMTKGAIYHHYKSKEEILEAVINRLFDGREEALDELLDAPGLTGRERLRRSMGFTLSDPSQDQMFQVAPDLMKNPRVLAKLFEDTFYHAAPEYIQPMVEQGTADGSIPTDQPRELSQVLALLCNLWINPAVCHVDSREELAARLRFLNTLLSPFGLGGLVPEMTEKLLDYQSMYQEKNPGREHPPAGSVPAGTEP